LFERSEGLNMRDESIYHEYSDWKLINNDLIEKLKAMDSPLIIRIEHVLNVVEYCYDKLIDDPNYTDEDHAIFEHGFYYIYDQMEEIKSLLKENYHNDFMALNLDAKKINLLLNTIDFENEMLNYDEYDEKGMQFFLDFEEAVKEKIINKEPITNEMYETLDVESDKIFKRMKVEVRLIQTIYMEIADELDLI